MKKATKSNLTPVVITTDQTKRGVFFGYINEEDAGKEDIVVHDLQMCLFWSKEVKGVLGLAANGPDSASRVSAIVPKGLVKGITLVMTCSPKAVKAWKAMPWS